MTITVSTAFTADPTLPPPEPDPQPGQVLLNGTFVQVTGAVLSLTTGEGLSLGSLTLGQANAGVTGITELSDGTLLIESRVNGGGPGGPVTVPWHQVIDPDAPGGPALVAGPALLGVSHYPQVTLPIPGGAHLLLSISTGPIRNQTLQLYGPDLTPGAVLGSWNDIAINDSVDQVTLLPGGTIALLIGTPDPAYRVDVIDPTGALVSSSLPTIAVPRLVATQTGFVLFHLAAPGGDVMMEVYDSAGNPVATQNISDPTGGAAGVASLGQAVLLSTGLLAVTYQPQGGGPAILRLADPGLPAGVNSTFTPFAVPGTALSQDPSGLLTLGNGVTETWFRDDRIVTSDAASDVMAGTRVIESFRGNGGIDTVDYSATAIGVVVDLVQGRGFGQTHSASAFDRYQGIENITGSQASDRITGNGLANLLDGQAGNDQLFGREGDDRLFGGSGLDRLDGGTGNDTMEGGLGNDRYIVDSLGDVVAGEVGFSLGGGIDTVESFVSFTLPANVEVLRLMGTANISGTGSGGPDNIVGNTGNNTLTGGFGNDQMNGKAGDDRLIGGAGVDTLVGGLGADTFVYQAVSDSRAGAANRDVLNGFDRGAVQDQIDLSAIDANTGTAANDAFTFIGTAAFTAAGQVRIQSLGGPNAVIVEVNVNAGLAADMQIFVNLQTTMVAGDFLL